MKKIFTVTMAILLCFIAKADDMYLRGPEVFRAVAMMIVLGMFMYFILAIMKRIFENRLKNKIVDKGISGSVAQSILDTRTSEDNKYSNVKWFAILAGLGTGLIGVNYTQPLGFHSLAIMAFSISLSFLGYYLFIRSLSK